MTKHFKVEIMKMRQLIALILLSFTVACGAAITKPAGLDITDKRIIADIKTIGIVGPFFDPTMNIAENDRLRIAEEWRSDFKNMLDEYYKTSFRLIILPDSVAKNSEGFNPEDKYDPKRARVRLDYHKKMGELAGIIAKEQGVDALVILYFDIVKITPNPSLAHLNSIINWDGATDVNKSWDSYGDISAISLSALLVKASHSSPIWTRSVGYKLIQNTFPLQKIMEKFPNNKKMCLLRISSSLIENFNKR